MKFNYLFLIFAVIFFLSSSFAIVLTESDLNTTIYLDSNVLIDYNGFYFSLDFVDENAGINSYLEIDCNNKYVILDYNSGFSGFFISSLDDNFEISFALNELIVRNCNFITNEFTGFGGTILIFENIPNVSILDSNINIANSSFIWTASESNLDFSGSQFDLNQSMFLYVLGGNISYIEIYNLDINYFLDADYGIITVNESSDLNYLKVSNSNLNSIDDAGFFNKRYQTTPETDYNLRFEFENVVANNLIFSDLDLNLDYNFQNVFDTQDLNESSNIFEFAENNCFFTIDPFSNINSINILQSNMILKNACFLFSTQENLELDFSDFNLFLEDSDENKLTAFLIGDMNLLTIFGLNMVSYGLAFFQNPTYLNIFDSNIFQEGYFMIFLDYIGDVFLNFQNTNFVMGFNEDHGENTFLYVLFSDLNTFSISNLNISTDVNYYNFLQVGYSNVSNLVLTNSVIELSNFFYFGFSTVSGIIYNNLFGQFNPDINYILYSDSNIDLSFNNYLEENSLKRSLIFDALNVLINDLNIVDDSNWIGGNLWLDVNGGLICELDNYSPKGICDDSFTISGWDNNLLVSNYYYDYYPLTIDFILPDLNVYSYTINSTGIDNLYLTTGDFVDINFYFENSGLIDVNDVNMILIIQLLDDWFYDDSDVNLINLVSGEGGFYNYNLSISDFIGFGEDEIKPGFYDLNFILKLNTEDCSYLNDENCLNNFLFIENAFGIYEDVNYVLEVQSLDVNQDYPGIVRFDCNVMNLGLNSSDRDYNVVFLYDYNGFEYNGYYLQEFFSTDVIDSFEIETVSFEHLVEEEGTYRFACMVQDDRYIEGEQLKYYIEKEFHSLDYIDFTINELLFSGGVTNLDSKTIDCNVGNIGTKASILDYNVLFYVNDILYDFNLMSNILNINEYNLVSFNWDPIIGGDYNLKCEVDYLGQDKYLYNNNLDYNVVLLYTDLNIFINVPDVNAGHTIDINCIINNIGNSNVNDLNVGLYINDILFDSNIVDLVSIGENYNQIFSFNPSAKVNDLNIGCVLHYSDYNNLNNSYFIDKNVGADSDVDLTISSISFSGSLTDYSAKTIGCNVGNIGLETATEDYNVLFYVNNVLTNSNLVFNDLNVGSYNVTSFSWTPSANGTYNLKCEVDYNVNNYLGFDQNIDNNSMVISRTITLSTEGPGGPGTPQKYDLKAVLTTSNNVLSKDSNIILNSNITNIGSKELDSAVYEIYFYSDDDKIVLFSDNFSESNLPLNLFNTLTLNNLLSYGNILDLVDPEGKIKLYLEVIASDDGSLVNNLSTKIISINYLEANLDSLKINDLDLINEFRFDLEKDYTVEFNIDYLGVNSNDDITLNLRSNKRLIYTKKITFNEQIINESYSDSIELNILDFVSESEAKELILQVYGFDLNNSIHREKYYDLLSKLGIKFEGVSFSDNDYYLELSLNGQDYSENSNSKIDFSFYSSVSYSDTNSKEFIIDGEKDSKKKEEIRKYFLKYKYKLGLDENQIIFIYDDKNNFISNESIVISFKDNSYYFKTDFLGKVIYIPELDGNYNIIVSNLGLKGEFEVIKGYKSSDLDYIIFENSIVFSESNKSKIVYYIIPFLGIIILVLLAFFIFYYKKPKISNYDFTLNENYLKSEFFEKEQLEKDIKLAKREENILERKVIKKEIEFAKKEEFIIEQKISNNKKYRFKEKIIQINKEDKILENKLKQKTGYDL